MSAVATATKKFQLGSAALAVAAAATLTPVVGQAAPSFAPLAGIGSSASSVVDSVIIPNASATASVVVDPCVAANFKLGCYTVQGAIAGTRAIVRGVVVYVGTIAYVLVQGTGELLKAVGNILPGPLGNFFTNVGDGVSAFANNIAVTLHVGPYLHSV